MRRTPFSLTVIATLALASMFVPSAEARVTVTNSGTQQCVGSWRSSGGCKYVQGWVAPQAGTNFPLNWSVRGATATGSCDTSNPPNNISSTVSAPVLRRSVGGIVRTSPTRTFTNCAISDSPVFTLGNQLAVGGYTVEVPYSFTGCGTTCGGGTSRWNVSVS